MGHTGLHTLAVSKLDHNHILIPSTSPLEQRSYQSRSSLGLCGTESTTTGLDLAAMAVQSSRNSYRHSTQTAQSSNCPRPGHLSSAHPISHIATTLILSYALPSFNNGCLLTAQ